MATHDELSGGFERVKEAMAFLNLVTTNNPMKTIADIEKRPDVQEALAVVRGWLKDVEATARAFPKVMVDDTLAVLGTTEVMKKEITDEKVWTQPKQSEKLVIRMNWLLQWILWPLSLLDMIFNARSTRKVWTSRLTPQTCTWCRALHGTDIPITASFADAARAVGWKRIYGSLLVPPLHPHCQCYLTYH